MFVKTRVTVCSVYFKFENVQASEVNLNIVIMRNLVDSEGYDHLSRVVVSSRQIERQVIFDI